MLEYERIDISEGIDCHYWYFSNKNFIYGPYLCDRCYNIMQKSNNFKNIAIVHVKKVYTEFIFNI